MTSDDEPDAAPPVWRGNLESAPATAVWRGNIGALLFRIADLELDPEESFDTELTFILSEAEKLSHPDLLLAFRALIERLRA